MTWHDMTWHDMQSHRIASHRIALHSCMHACIHTYINHINRYVYYICMYVYIYIWFIRIRMHTITYWFDVRSGWSLPIVRWIRLSRKLAPTDGHSWHPRHTGPWQRMRRMGIACIPGHDFLGTQWKRMPYSSKCFFYSPWGTTSEGLVHDLQNLEGMLCAPRILIQRRL